MKTIKNIRKHQRGGIEQLNSISDIHDRDVQFLAEIYENSQKRKETPAWWN